MEIKIAHCLFEQSGTFKNEFKKLGIDAYDYDIQNNFNQTDYVIDLFSEIENAYDNKPSVFDNITPDDLIMAFFPCIYFEVRQMTYYSGDCINLRYLKPKEKMDTILTRIENREKFLKILYKLFFVCELRGLRLILENPAMQPNYLLFTQNFYRKPSVIVNDRTRRGDCFKKPTAYWFFNCEPTYGESYSKPLKVKTISLSKASGKAGICSEERSMIEPIYARNFICDFIIGQPNENSNQIFLF